MKYTIPPHLTVELPTYPKVNSFIKGDIHITDYCKYISSYDDEETISGFHEYHSEIADHLLESEQITDEQWDEINEADCELDY